MTAAALKSVSVLRTASGEPPLGHAGLTFRDDQGETFAPHDQAYQGAGKIGVMELENGLWLARPFKVNGVQFKTRDGALRSSIARMIRNARRFMRSGEGEGTHWSEGFAGRVIEWALSLKPEETSRQGVTIDASPANGHPGSLQTCANSQTDPNACLATSKEINPPANVANDLAAESSSEEITPEMAAEELTIAGYTASDAGASLSDPVVRYLVEQHALRKQFPAKHTFSMTTEVAEGRIVSVATCACKQVFKFGSNDHLRMNAAIEAHWRRFSHEKIVDGRGQPINGEERAAPSQRKQHSKRTKRDRSAEGHPNAGGEVQPANAPLPEPVSSTLSVADAGSLLSEAGGNSQPRNPAPVEVPSAGAGGIVDAPIGAADDDDDLDLDWPSYQDFLEDKIVIAPMRGIEVPRDALHPYLKPHCKDLVVWALRLGCSAIFANFGLHKTAMQLEWCRQLVKHTAQPSLCVVPLGVRHGFIAEALRLGMEVHFVRTTAELDHLYGEGQRYFLTNYESIREGKLDPNQFGACSLDEASVLRSYGSKTFQEFLPLFSKVMFKLVATATPSPNRYKELIHYSGFLGVMDTGLALTRFFQRNSEKAGDLTLYEHKAEEFWMWIHSWAIFLQKPSELCRCTCHSEKNLSTGDLGASKSSDGRPAPSGTVRGDASAIAEASGLRPQTICSPEASEAADAFGQNMAESTLQLTKPGDRWSSGSSATERNTPTEGSPSANDGVNSQTSSPIWDSRQQALPSTEETTTATTNRETADGRPAKNRRGIPGATSGSATTEESKRSPNGLKSAASTISCSTLDTKNTVGHPQKCSASFCQRCAELDEGYQLPPLKIRWHEVPADHSKAEPERDGQSVMFRDVANSLSEAATARRDSLPARIAKMLDVIAQDPDSHRLIWHELEAEREAIEKALPGVVTIMGSMDIDAREARLHDFEEGRIRHFATKPILSGSGSNFQYHCHKAIYVAMPGYGYKFNDFLQSLYRLQRFGQAHPVEVDIIFSEDERAGKAALEEKWARDTEMRLRMSEIIKRHGLNTLPLRDALLRAIGVQRVEIASETVKDGTPLWRAINNDAVAECRAWPDNNVDQIVTSIPFSNHYEYSPSYRDFGHTDDNGHFWSQMDFLTRELLRMLKPGRLACIHVKDRILFGAVTGQGVPTISPFHAEAIMHYRAHGFQYMGMITVVTDVVRENNQTYRLGWSENAKDSTKMGCGSPEYILLMRKPQSNRAKGYADDPVTKVKPDLFAGDGDGYSRARWQIDAHAFWRSSGNRLLSMGEFADFEAAELARLFSKTSADRVYDFETHVKIGEVQERKGTLPATFMSIAPGSSHPDVWTDINRMRTLNMMQQRKGAEMHLCLAAGSLVLTREGHKPIEDVSLGDQVLTHKGRWRPVLVKQNTGRRPAVTVKAQGVSGLTLTPDHKLWTRKVRSLAGSIAHSRKEAKRTDPDWVRADETLGSYVNLKLPPVEIPSTESLRYWWTIGRWLADGHFSRKARSYVISCGHHEVDFLIQQLGEFGTNKPHDVGTAVQIILKKPAALLRKTLELCGHGASGKHLPPEAFTLPPSQARALLDGYLSGDGHWLPQRNRWMATSVSRELLLGIAMLAQRAYGVVSSIYPGREAGQTTIEGRVVNTKQEWVLSFDVTTDGRYKGKPLILDDGAWKKVRSVELAGEVDTWNLRVEEDESYTAEGCIVKNCPLQFDIVDRLIERYSNEGELIFDPFGGLMTVPYRAVLKGRKGAATELSAPYFLDGVHYLRAAEEKITIPALFDLAAFDAANPSPPPSTIA